MEIEENFSPEKWKSLGAIELIMVYIVQSNNIYELISTYIIFG